VPKQKPRSAGDGRRKATLATARQREQFLQSEARYRNLVENTLDWIWEMNLDGRHTYSNGQLEHILGYSGDEFAELSLDRLIHPEDMQLVEARLPALIANKEGWKSWVLRFRHKDRSYRYLESNAHPILDAAGAVIGFRGVDRDVTDRMRVEQKLEDSEEKVRALLSAVPDMIFRMGRDGRYIDFHASERTLLAVSPANIIGRGMDDLFEGSLLREGRELVDKTLDTGELQLWEYQLPVGDETRDFEARLVRSGPDEIIAIVRDITERTRLEREVVSIGESERRRIGRDLHDGLGQELTGVSLGLSALSQKLSSARSPHAASAKDLSAILQRSIVETQRIVRLLSPEIPEAKGLVASLRLLAREVNQHTGVRCTVSCSADTDVHDEETAIHLYRIAQESINNALKHSGAKSIQLNFGRDTGAFFLEVLDDGIGIAPEGQRAEGMGLRSMRYRGRMLRGKLDVTPRMPAGTRVRCSWRLRAD